MPRSGKRWRWFSMERRKAAPIWSSGVLKHGDVIAKSISMRARRLNFAISEESSPTSTGAGSISGSPHLDLHPRFYGGTTDSGFSSESVPDEMQGGDAPGPAEDLGTPDTQDPAVSPTPVPPCSWKKRHRRQGFVPESREPSGGRK